MPEVPSSSEDEGITSENESEEAKADVPKKGGKKRVAAEVDEVEKEKPAKKAKANASVALAKEVSVHFTRHPPSLPSFR